MRILIALVLICFATMTVTANDDMAGQVYEAKKFYQLGEVLIEPMFEHAERFGQPPNSTKDEAYAQFKGWVTDYLRDRFSDEELIELAEGEPLPEGFTNDLFQYLNTIGGRTVFYKAPATELNKPHLKAIDTPNK